MPVRTTIPMHLIDEPEIAMRSDIDDDYLRSLADDIAAVGLINPISVKQVDGRYQVGAGHCRYLAHKLLGRETIDASDYTGEDTDMESIKFAENMMRNDVNDADVALWLAEIQDKYHHDIETLMRLTRRSEHWINIRLRLFQGDKRVLEALQKGLIKLGHAVTLNRFPENFRAQYLDACINSTPPVKVLEQWLIDLGKMGIGDLQQPGEGAHVHTDQPLPGVVVTACWLCGSDTLNWTMVFPAMHKHCQEMIQKQIEQAGG